MERTGLVTATVALRVTVRIWTGWMISAACWRLTRA